MLNGFLKLSVTILISGPYSPINVISVMDRMLIIARHICGWTLPIVRMLRFRNQKGIFAIVPGKPEQSELIKRITSSDVSYAMPPSDAHLGALTEYEKKLFEKWIEQGAKYEKHWLYSAQKNTAPFSG